MTRTTASIMYLQRGVVCPSFDMLGQQHAPWATSPSVIVLGELPVCQGCHPGSGRKILHYLVLKT